MKRPLIGVILFAVGLPVGWVLAGIGAGVSAAGADARQPAGQSPRARAAGGERTFARPVNVAEFGVPIGELEGLHAFHGASPVPTFKNWQTGLEILAKWLDLPPAEKQALEEILEEAARRLVEWEEQHIAVSSVDDVFLFVLMEWKVSPALRQDLRAAIDDAFGPERARSIWLKGDLANFGRLPATLVSGDGATIRLQPGTPSASSVQVSSFDGLPRRLGLPRSRFDHLIDWDGYFAAQASARNAPHPEAEAVPGRPGFVISPITGKIIDITGIPGGTLVKDPTIIDGGIFRTPAAAEDE